MVEPQNRDWRTIVGFLKDTDENLFKLILRKLMNHLCTKGIEEAQQILYINKSHHNVDGYEMSEDENRPLEKAKLYEISGLIFAIAEKYVSNEEMGYRISKWIQEDKISFFVRALENFDTTVEGVQKAIEKFCALSPEKLEMTESMEEGLVVSLIRRFLTDDLEFISFAKDHVQITDFLELTYRMIYPEKSHGKIGGKSVGIFIADKILRKASAKNELFKSIKIPKTWHITSDGIIEFIHYNNLEEVVEHKYKDIEQIRQEYPYLVQVFKNSSFPPEIIKGLSYALDDFEDRPLVIRSSSLLEDSIGAAFSGKYKSLFVANTGTKQERLTAIMDAIAEVYASTFSPDPIEYRAERGLLDYNEEMGIIIQEVVGKQVGKYFLPAYAGVAFSNNEFRWSPRIKREDGLLRLVPGLGTRAVDRVAEDYPILIAPGQPGLRVNITPKDVIRYSPKKIDVINLETNTFETIEISDLMKDYADEYPGLTNVFSAGDHNQIRQFIQLDIDAERKNLVVTFNGLVSNTPFIQRMKAIIYELREAMKSPVDIEFASDGSDIHLLQCRPQSFSVDAKPAPIPADIPKDKIIFTANRFISNGRVPDVTHIVYIDPETYSELEDLNELQSVGRAVGKLNKILPKRRFILMGPGRWGSRGDIKLGVNVTYSDINNTSMLIEMAKQKGNYVPDLSFGTHFFQDLVEASIRYLPLYPDDEGITFNQKFFDESKNILVDILPEFKNLKNVVKVIDVQSSLNGQQVKVLMNADLDRAVAYLVSPATAVDFEISEVKQVMPTSEDNWRWRRRMSEKIASQLDGARFGVEAFYVVGSTKNATALSTDDIDIVIHYNGTEEQKKQLQTWLEGWDLCLTEMNYIRTGVKIDKILDVKFISTLDIEKKRGIAERINSITDPAKRLPLKNK